MASAAGSLTGGKPNNKLNEQQVVFRAGFWAFFLPIGTSLVHR
jgi:hypothetical protein